MKKYRVSKGLKPYVRRVLIRSFYKASFRPDDDGTIWCFTNANSDTFHRIVQRAKCEKKEAETGEMYVTAKEAQDRGYLTYFLDRAGKNNYSVIDDKDWSRLGKQL